MADALLVVSFGGPEGQDDVIPFLQNVLRGSNVPMQRLDQVAQHYRQFGGVSPINGQIRSLIAALKDELAVNDIHLPIYWGNRNWHPFLADTVQQMADDGVQRALAFVTSAYASYSGCHQYLDDIAEARAKVGQGAPEIDKLRVFYNHPGFVGPNADNLRAALVGAGSQAAVAFTAHSLPVSMAATSDYVGQLNETARLVADQAGAPAWQLVYQSRSGPPTQPWLEPDIGDHRRSLARAGVGQVVVAPIGFVSDHMEVVYNLDIEARGLADELGLKFMRAATVGTAPAFVTMIRQLVQERLDPCAPKLALGDRGPYHDLCPAGCCCAFF
ncbi:MAG TPA: ferrochelatase [Acidimicrobiales bacterium]|nr:ferrochelatase [Acidimicrobiales bacterium]